MNLEKMNMKTKNMCESNVAEIAALFPQCVTEVVRDEGPDPDGRPRHAATLRIDWDKLRAELGSDLIPEGEERYQFTWPDKRAASCLANTPTDKTLRPDVDASVDFWNTKNLYIEGDNLDVLKVLREDYLGKVKMIYIDPPYNTGNDFVYNDDFAQDSDEWRRAAACRDLDEDGNQLIDQMQRNTESNGRFHTDWLNMIYPRLKVARDLLTEDGVIFISIGDEELQNLRKVCDEVFGEDNFRNQIIVRRGAKSVQAQFETWDKLGQGVEYLLFYTKNSGYRFPKQMKPLDEFKEGAWNNHWRGTDRPSMRYPIFGITPKSGQWRWGKERSDKAIENYNRMLIETAQSTDCVLQSKIDSWYFQQPDAPDLLRLSTNGKPEHYIPPTNETLLNNSWSDLLIGSSSEMSRIFDSKVFDTPKLTAPILRMLNFVSKDALILDFFSGSATTAHAVMKLNAEDGGKRKFIMVQLPEVTDEKSEARKAGYETICQIGEERIRRAGKKILEEVRSEKLGVRSDKAGNLFEQEDSSQLTSNSSLKDNSSLPDVGFRVLKLDSSNMEDVFYTPEEFDAQNIFTTVDNVKSDRTPLDLLFQVLPELNIELSAKIETQEVNGKKVFFVDGNYLIATFDTEVNESTVTEIARMKPQYFVMRDASAANDNVLDNFEQIFRHYSPDTVRKIL